MPSGLQQNQKLKGTPPVSQKMGKNQTSSQGSTANGLVSLSLSGGGGQQGGGGQPNTFTFPIRPEQFQLDWPARQTVTQTINGAYQDHWGNGIGQIQLSGHTGWRKHEDSSDDGYAAFIKLRNIHDQYCQMCGDGVPANVRLELVVAVPNNFGHYRVSSDRFRTLKNTQSPLLYRYEIQFTVLEDLASAGPTSGPTVSGSLFTNNVTTTGLISDSAGIFTSLSNQLSAVGDTLLPQQTYPYVANAGDNLQSLAQRLLGNISYSSLILRYNSSLPLNKDLTPGTVINIPVLGTLI